MATSRAASIHGNTLETIERLYSYFRNDTLAIESDLTPNEGLSFCE
jgi:hypothetical protein